MHACKTKMKVFLKVSQQKELKKTPSMNRPKSSEMSLKGSHNLEIEWNSEEEKKREIGARPK